MPDSSAKLSFWGVRGSTPTPERQNGRYGGNTPCLELHAPDGSHIVLDCGTGLRALGNRWTQLNAGQGLECHVLVTHYHWDHIQGIPFFHPFFEPQNHFHFYSFESRYLGPDSLRKALESQLASPYFPIGTNLMAAQRSFRDVSGGESWQIGSVRVSTERLNHPQGCLGYRLETGTGSIVYATDNEPDGGGEFDKNLRRLAQNADVLIYDAQYSPEQLASARKGWGHSSWLEAVKIARECKVQNLLLFHHDPDSTDRMVDGYLSAARQEFPATWAATEGMTVDLSEMGVEVKLRESRVGLRKRLRFSATVTGQGEDGSKFEEKATVRDLTLLGAYLSLNSRPRLQSELRIVIEAGEGNRSSLLAFRGTVIHCDLGREQTQNGIGVAFIEETEPGVPRD